MNTLGRFIEQDFRTRYYTTVFTVGRVLTNMCNPLRSRGIRAEEADSKDLPFGFITA